jgi:hypothetical protein
LAKANDWKIITETKSVRVQYRPDIAERRVFEPAGLEREVLGADRAGQAGLRDHRRAGVLR